MNRLGMIINVSHSSDETIAQAIEVSADPVVATHHGLRSVNNIPRNMPDELLKKRSSALTVPTGSPLHRGSFRVSCSPATMPGSVTVQLPRFRSLSSGTLFRIRSRPPASVRSCGRRSPIRRPTTRL